jgi:hypothetical protein
MVDEFQRFQFQRSQRLLPAGEYCVGCLGRLFGDSPDTIKGYLGTTAGHEAKCVHCRERALRSV